MTKIVQKRLPNAVGNADVTDPVVRQKVMLLQENIKSIASQLAEAQKALVELQRNPISFAGEAEAILITAAADATAKANAAKAGAEATASADATAKANAAIAAAAVDATEKANAARTGAEATASSALSAHSSETTGNVQHMTSEEKTKLANITPGATAVTESTVSGWGFTKNTGTYTKPSSGIPREDLENGVQTSLGKADASSSVYVKTFSATTGSVTNTSSQTVTKDISLAGYTPIMIGNVSCLGNNSSDTRTFRTAICSSSKINGTNAVIVVDNPAPPVAISHTVSVDFSVLYVKN